ncbi:MAG: PLP-dependent lyase/thiolase [Candidatus Magasanikbacteria bacterium]|nr:PLP-dependent lyase/thiolase [Candidatus Magasanikbacteria bacterium]
MQTPQKSYPNLASSIGVPMLYLKREDMHEYKSHKGRSIPKMIESYIKTGITEFVVSSSGNAGLTAMLFVKKHNKTAQKAVKLAVFVGKKISEGKLKPLNKLTDENIEIKQVERPKQQAFLEGKKENIAYLRQSTDETALEGYKSLAEELDEIENLEAIFVPTSSGTTAEALGKHFESLKQNPQIHIVQTESCNPIASEFMKWDKIDVEDSIAGAIVDNVAHRKDIVTEIVKNSKGSGWIVTNNEIKSAINITVEDTEIEISPNSALSVAGLIKARESGWSWNGAIVCLITGK